MARVTGPLHSDGASGTLNGSITYSHWKGRDYVRTCVTPKNPKAAKQTGVRAMFGFLAAAWAAIKVASSASWKTLANASSISPFNAYIQANQKTWQDSAAPTASYPAAKAASPLTVTTQTVTGGSKMATAVITPSGATSIWGIILYRGTTGFTPSWANAVKIVPANGASAVTIVDDNVTPGTYAYRAAVFTTDGVLGTIHAETAGIVVTAQ